MIAWKENNVSHNFISSSTNGNSTHRIFCISNRPNRIRVQMSTWLVAHS